MGLFNSDQDFVNQYLKEIRHYPQLNRDEERNLLEDFHKNGNQESFNRLITSNLRFVVSVAVKYQNQGLSMPELINEGNLGLMEAIRRFDPAKYSVKFISYAVWWIRQSIIKSLYETSRLVRVSAEKESKLKMVNRLAEVSLQEHGRIDYDYVARHSRTKPQEVEQILSLGRNRVSMDEPLGDDNDGNIYDVLPDETVEAPDNFLKQSTVRRSIDELMDTLNPQERTVVDFYFGLNHETDFNLDQVGRKLKISKERVRQIKKKALEKMKANYGAYAVAMSA